MKIIVADDEPDMRDYLSRMLTFWGHEVQAVVGDGRELVLRCQEYVPDLIITDLIMPEMNGDVAVKVIWQRHPCAVILVSAYQCPLDFDTDSDNPPFRYLNKPINRTKLQHALASLPTTT